MRRFSISAFCLVSAFVTATPRVDAQTIAPATSSNSHVTASHSTRVATTAHPSVAAPHYIAHGPMNYQGINSRPAGMIGRPGMNPRTARTPFLVANVNVGPTARTYRTQPNNAVAPRSEAAQNTSAITTEQRVIKTDNAQAIADILSRRQTPHRDPVTTGLQPDARTLQPTSSDTAPRGKLDPAQDRHSKNDHAGFTDALRRHPKEWHDCNWWRQHCDTIVFVSNAFFFLDGSYWYPAWGYDPLYSNYDYDGPIYTYGNLLPDEVIANVQVALQEAGYYNGPITGSLDVQTRAALANYQRDQGLPVTAAIDQPTTESLGLQ